MITDSINDKELSKIENRISKQYNKAYEELGNKWEDYIKGWNDENGIHHKGLQERYDEQFKAFQQGKYTEAEFKDWYATQVARGEHIRELQDEMANRLNNSAEIAQEYVNNRLPKIYVNASNSIAQIATESAMKQGVLGINFNLLDEHTVKLLMTNANAVKPYVPMNIATDRLKTWNYKQIQNAILQGVLQGDSIGDIAKRFINVVNNNKASAIRTARTAVTGVRNRAKQNRFDDLASKGCSFTKIWVSAHDSRTRDAHKDADGQEVDYKDCFDVGGEQMLYPADWSNGASGWNIYNCRCTMQTGEIKFHSILTDEQRRRANIRVY